MNQSMLVAFANMVVEAYEANNGPAHIVWGYGEDDGGKSLTWANAYETDAILVYRMVTGK